MLFLFRNTVPLKNGFLFTYEPKAKRYDRGRRATTHRLRSAGNLTPCYCSCHTL